MTEATGRPEGEPTGPSTPPITAGPPPGSWGPPPGSWGPPPGSWGPPGSPVPPGSAVPPGSPAPPPSWNASPPGPDWHRLAPQDLARLHQPGIVPLRPLTLGDIFGGALQTMRRNPAATIGAGFVVLAVLLVPSYFASLAIMQVEALAVEDRSAVLTLVSALLSALASVALTGMIVHVVGEAVLGDRASLGETWSAVRGRIPALLANLLILSALLVVVVGILVAAGVLAAVLAPDANVVVAGLLGAIGVVAVVVLLLWVGIRLSLAPAAIVLEQTGPLRGLRRAWSLTTGRQGWRIVGITVVAAIVTGLFGAVVQMPATFILLLTSDIDVLADEAFISPLFVGVDHLVQLIVGALTIPFTAGVTALLYLDQRIRREGLETALLQTAQARAAARQP